ncbi:ZIP family metal transporter [Salinisphaera sp. T31B1]|uniref:ZIP family metal transporter n=1 Tax=Salinisphaera sp. T31B1 TaxID=727963 RepID=UPI003340FF0A
MDHTGSGAAADPLGRGAGHAVGLIFFCVVAFGALAGYDKVALIALTAFGAMTAGAVLGYRATGASAAWQALDGVAGGAMIAAACILLLPAAIALDPPLAGLGVALGLLFGHALHRACRERAWRPGALGESSLIALTVHSAGAGVVIGMLYGQMPELGLWLGTVIVAHKLPAGYAIARRLRAQGGALAGIALPACAVGVVAVPVAMATTVLPPSAAIGAVCQGLAAGIFLHVGLECVALEGAVNAAVDTPGWRIWLPVGAGMALMMLLRIAFG